MPSVHQKGQNEPGKNVPMAEENYAEGATRSSSRKLLPLKGNLKHGAKKQFDLKKESIEIPPDGVNEHFATAAFGNAFVGMTITNLNGVITQVNPAFSAIVGFTEPELVAKDIRSFVYADDIQFLEKGFEDARLEHAASPPIITRYQNKSAELVWVKNNISIIKGQDGRSENVLIISVDIHEEKSAQQKAEEITKRFRFLADSMPQLIWTADSKGQINYFSHAFYDYTGLSLGEVKNSNWEDLVFADDREETRQLWRESIETGEEFSVEHRLRRRDGRHTWQLSRAVAQRDHLGNILLWLGTTSNIHRQKTVADELEKQVLERTKALQQANFTLKHSNHDLEQFAYIATHDLQEPLRKIRTYASWINKRFLERLPEEAQDYVLKIEAASERMSVLIDDLLNYSLLLRPLEAYEESDLNYILSQVIADFESRITQKGAVITTEELPHLKVVPLQIYELFHNLLSNALKFSKENRPPVIAITCRPLSEEEVIALNLDIDLAYIEIIFKDNGIGFRQEYAEKIFSIFQRLNSRNRFPGTGIGLALCQKIVTYHHGRIYATSVENEGASFYILLPV